MSKGTINKVMLLGRLGADAEIRYTSSGTTVANLRIATNNDYKDRQTGEFVEKTEWHNAVVFGKQADIISQYTKKGSLIYIEGKIRTNKWKNQSGQDRYTTEIIALDFQLFSNYRNKENTQINQKFSQESSMKPSSKVILNNQKNTELLNSPKSSIQKNINITQINDFNDDDIPF